MGITVYCLANNEEMLMPYYMRHYSQFAHVIILDNNSTDNTVNIAKSLGAEIITLDIPDEINDQLFVDIRNNCWKNSDADWIMWADADEFIYHPDITEFLKNTDATAILPAFYNMYSDTFPTTDGQIYDEVKLGSRWGGEENLYGKVNIFKLPDIKEINYNAGCHRVNLKGNIKLITSNEIKTLHMRNLSREFVVNRNARSSKRLSEFNRVRGWGLYVDMTASEIRDRFDKEMREATIVINDI
jgi:glycosyltransferase involved in cell wall biosynthesis